MRELKDTEPDIEGELKQYSTEMLNLCGDVAKELLKGNYDIHKISISLSSLVNMALKTHRIARILENQKQK